MRIICLHIDGFGRFANRTFGPFERPVTVFHGLNEAGKSTLLEFIRRVFFGFPDGRSSSNLYPPLAGGHLGGNVTIVSDVGTTVTVHRVPGARGGPVRLTAASGGPLPSGELQPLLGHDSGDVFHNVFTFTLDELHSDALLKDDSVNAQIFAAGMGATKLPGALGTLKGDKRNLFLKRGSNHEIFRATEKLKKIESQLTQVENNAAEYARLTSQLKEDQEELSGLNRRRQKYQSQLDLQRQLESAWDGWNDLLEAERQLAELPVIDAFPVKGVSRMETLEKQIETAQNEYDSADEELEKAQAKADEMVEHEAILKHSSDIRELGEGRTSFRNSLRDLPKRKGDLIRLQNKRAKTLNDLGTDWDETRLEAFDLSISVRQEISQYRDRLRKADETFNRSEFKRDQAEEDLEHCVETEKKARQEFQSAANPGGRRNVGKVLAALGVSGGIALVVAGAILGGDALPIGVVAGVLLVCVAAYLFAVGQSSTGKSAAYASLSRDLAKAIESTKLSKTRLGLSKEDVRKTGTRLEGVRGEWRQWLAERGLREEFSPDNIEVLCRLVDLARTHHDEVVEMKRRVDTIQKDIDKYVAIAAPLASGFGVPFDRNDSNSAAAAAGGLIELHGKVEREVSARTAARADLKKTQHRLEHRASNLRRAKGERKDLLQSGGASDVENFRERAKIVGRRTESEERRAGALGRLQRLSGPGEPLATLKRQLGDTDFQAIRGTQRLINDEIEKANTRTSELSKKQGSNQTKLNGLVGEEESSKLRAERHRLLEEIRGHAREWAVRTVAENLLKEAQGKFERERQPDVVRHAESFFKGITDGRYQTIFSPLDKPEIWVTDSANVSKQPSQLSSGTLGQLFLSLRFGLIRELGRRSERLPVILDEALVNFDPERGLRAARAFVELSQTNQVLVFTCHPTIVELFRSAAAQSGAQEPEVVQIG